MGVAADLVQDAAAVLAAGHHSGQCPCAVPHRQCLSLRAGQYLCATASRHGLSHPIHHLLQGCPSCAARHYHRYPPRGTGTARTLCAKVLLGGVVGLLDIRGLAPPPHSVVGAQEVLRQIKACPVPADKSETGVSRIRTAIVHLPCKQETQVRPLYAAQVIAYMSCNSVGTKR